MAAGFHHDIHLDYSDCKGEYKFRVMKMQMHAGIGTHMDAPSHCIQGGKCINEFEINDLVMPCFVIDGSDKADESYSIMPEDIKAFESRFNTTISQNSCVIIKTGWEKFWNEPKKYHNDYLFPSVSAEAADLLLKRGVAALGIDTLSPDHTHQVKKSKYVLYWYYCSKL